MNLDYDGIIRLAEEAKDLEASVCPEALAALAGGEDDESFEDILESMIGELNRKATGPVRLTA